MELQFISFGANIDDLYRGHAEDAGLDVRAPQDVIIKAHSFGPSKENNQDGLGFGLKLPSGYMGLLYPRSGLLRKGLVSQIAPIDPNYDGEWHYCLQNNSDEDITIHKGERIAQIVITPFITPSVVLKQDTERSDNGLGSTGLK